METSLKDNKVYIYRYFLAFLSIALVYFFNMLIDVMDVDAAQYASISREMLENGSYLEVYHKGLDYLDKPPLLFWLSSLSIKIFGLNNFAYKLPAILIIILGIYSTYRFTLLWYNRKTAIYAALILATTQAMFLVTNDVRTDGMLTGFVIFSVWQMSRFLREAKLLYLLYGAIGVAAAMMTKGPIGIILIAFSIGGDLLIKQQWKSIFKWEWLLFLLIVALLLIPMSIGLYTQFDLHPEKEVYGLSGPSGLRFFYWTQSFGRITGENYWKNDTSFFFFFHTILWDFQPWLFFFVPALFKRFRTLLLSKLTIDPNTEYISLFGFVLGFLALSSSGFKLPHYIFSLFPFAAIFTADFIGSLVDIKLNRRFARFQFGFMHLFFVVAILSFIFFFSPNGIALPIALILLFILFWVTFIKMKNPGDKIVLPTVVSIVAFGLVTSTYFYPTLLKYQAESVFGKEIKSGKVPSDQFYIYNAHGHSLDFYADQICRGAEPSKFSSYNKGTFIFTNEDGMEELINPELGYKLVKKYSDYNVTGLSFEFLLKDQREDHLEYKYLFEKK